MHGLMRYMESMDAPDQRAASPVVAAGDEGVGGRMATTGDRPS
jgi:hypothetical protein